MAVLSVLKETAERKLAADKAEALATKKMSHANNMVQINNENAKEKRNLSQSIDTAQLDYNNKLKAHKVKYDKVAALDMLEADYFNEIGKRPKFQTDEAQEILQSLKTFTYDDFETSASEVKQSGDHKQDMAEALRITEIKGMFLDEALKDAEEGAELAGIYMDETSADYELWNDSFDRSALANRFMQEYTNSVYNPATRKFSDPVFNAKYHAMVKTIPDWEERQKLQNTLSLMRDRDTKSANRIVTHEDALIEKGQKGYSKLKTDMTEYGKTIFDFVPSMTPENIKLTGVPNNVYSSLKSTAKSSDKFQTSEFLQDAMDKVSNVIRKVANTGTSLTNSKVKEMVEKGHWSRLKEYLAVRKDEYGNPDETWEEVNPDWSGYDPETYGYNQASYETHGNPNVRHTDKETGSKPYIQFGGATTQGVERQDYILESIDMYLKLDKLYQFNKLLEREGGIALYDRDEDRKFMRTYEDPDMTNKGLLEWKYNMGLDYTDSGEGFDMDFMQKTINENDDLMLLLYDMQQNANDTTTNTATDTNATVGTDAGAIQDQGNKLVNDALDAMEADSTGTGITNELLNR